MVQMQKVILLICCSGTDADAALTVVVPSCLVQSAGDRGFDLPVCHQSMNLLTTLYTSEPTSCIAEGVSAGFLCQRQRGSMMILIGGTEH